MTNNLSKNDSLISKLSLEYHKKDNLPGKIAMITTKPLATQHDLALAYSPGVSAPCLKIVDNINAIYDYTSRGNTVAVISNGTAVLGLGNLGAAAAKPVMEGKAALFKKFADIDAIDLEIDTEDPYEIIKLIQYLKYNWGGINLEDIKAPECFIIENKLQELVDIPVFHDDQHGTAVAVTAGVINAADLTGRQNLRNLKVIINGAGAAGIACAELLKSIGIENVILCDSQGVIYKGRTKGMNVWKEAHAIDTKYRTLKEVIIGADLFLGLSVKGALTQEMLATMADKPIIFALANPDPEIMPDEVKFVRPNAIVATGRSDFSNQINNVIVFPYIFRGALDVMATTINNSMKIAAAKEIAALATHPVPDLVTKAHLGRKMEYGFDYILPSPFDPRLLYAIPPLVASAAMKTGVARKNIDLQKYKNHLFDKAAFAE
ncbi:malic enzyme-like NAD(P)-binding protein [Orientia tsutsugamushi]|uniref:malic enzyme-like NAD(P)-binding protein n=1 Tax=Orientia tsutsugamushi TaxID=784 RepID=UPI00315DD3D2